MGRLVEYVVTAGIKRPNIDSTESPELLRRFPTTDHKDFPLPPDIVFFCQPEGCTTALRRISLRQTNTFVFTLTDKDTAITRYGICCNFFRPCFGIPQQRHQDIGKSFSYDSNSSSEDSCLASQSERLSELKRSKSTPLHGNTSENEFPHHINCTNSMLCFSLTSICIVSSYPFFSTFRECLFIFRKLVESRSWTREVENSLRKEKRAFFDGNQNIGHLPLVECRNWAIFFNTNDLMPNVIKSKLSDIDDWVNTLLKIPLPIAGHNRVEVELLPRHIQPPLTFALPEKSRFSFLDYPVHLPLELLGVETCLKILTCIILEHKVVLQSCDYNALSISVMALTSMLYPLQYMFPIIPLLPTCMKNAENLLLAPTPYVIGIPSSFFRIKGASFQVPHDVLIVDLDTNKMSVPLSMDEIPPLPEPDGTELKAQLNQCLSCLSFSPLPVNDQDSISDYSRQPDSADNKGNINPMIYGNDIDSVDIAVRAALVKFFCSPNVLGSFIQSTRILRLYPRPVVAFLKKPFIHSKEDKSGFLEALIETQAVEYYGEWMVNPENTVFRKVQNGILDPRIIGDKPRWYSHYVQPLYYQVHNPQSPLGLDLYEDSDTDSEIQDYNAVIEEQSEESDKEDVVDVCSCCSSFDDSDVESASGRKHRHLKLNHSVNSQIHDMYDSSYSQLLNEKECEGIQTAVLANSVYTPPAYRSEEDILSSIDRADIPDDEVNLDTCSEPSLRSDETSSISTGDKPTVVPSFSDKAKAVKKLSAIIGHMKPKLTRKPSSESLSSIISSTSIIRPANEGKNQSINNKFHSNVANQKIYRSSSYTWNSGSLLKQVDQSIYNSENQQFITEVVGYVKSGDGIGWLTTKKLRKVVTDEGLRHYLINQIDMDQSCKDITLNDVHVSRNVYRGYLELLKLVIEGYESSMNAKGLGGLSSLFSFLEVVHRYYCGKKYTDDSIGSEDAPKPKTSIADMVSEECTQRLEPPDVESEASLHFHRDLGNFSTMQQDENDNKENPGSPSLTYTSLEKVDPSKVNHSLPENNKSLTKDKEKQGVHLISKSNCSGGHRFYNGRLEKSAFEPAGRGVTGTGRRYLFEGLVRNRSWLWDDMDFWEQCFLDFVASEREAAGMDVNPIELISRYNSLNAKEKRSLEEDEDNLLGIILHNMIGFMLCTNVAKQKIKMKVRRLLAKAHIGLNQTQWIDNLLSSIEEMNGNDIDLLVPRSRQLKIQIFVVHLGDSQSGPVFFLEVREDCIVLKSTNGSIVDRWWYENVVNLSCSPKTKVLCLWIRSGEQTDLQKVCTKKCKMLYGSIKDSMKKAAEKLNKEGTGINLGGDFTVINTSSGQEGILKVSLEGLTIIFIDKKIYIDLRNLKNCCAKRKILIVEEHLPHTQGVMEHQFYTEEANEICYAILCLFSYIAAARNISPTRRDSTD